MIYQVIIRDAKGKIKKTFSPEQLTNKFWRDIEASIFKKKTYKPKKKQDWICNTCGKIFQASGVRKFCHNPCLPKSPKYTSLKERVCKQKGCEKRYMPMRNVQKFCQEHKGQRVYINRPPPLKKTCAICHEIFQPRINREIYCQDPCNTRHKKIKGLIYGQKPKAYSKPVKEIDAKNGADNNLTIECK